MNGNVLHKLALDFTKTHRTYQRGQITVYIMWTEGDLRPCMVLIPSRPRLHFDVVTPCVIPDLLAWAWAEETGDPAHAARSSLQFCDSLGWFPSPGNARMITGLVHDYIDDLITCPPRPKGDAVLAGFTKKADMHSGDVVSEGEIYDDV